jgi:hypothetical protein
MNDFLPQGYEPPVSTGNYMRLEDGENTFRILSSAIIGYEYWIDYTNEEGKASRKPIRKKMDEKIDISQVPEPDKIKHFWAFVVYNEDIEKIQILEITQKTIQKDIRALTNNKNWGDPKEYSICITKTGKELETKYSTMGIPPKLLDKSILDQYKEMNINLDALWTGDDPFENKINIEEVEKLLEVNNE